MSLLRRRMMMLQRATSGGGGLNTTLYEGENGQAGIDVYNYIVEHGVSDGYGNLDWYPTDQDNLYVTGSLGTNKRIIYAWVPDFDEGIYLWWDGQSDWYSIILSSSGILTMTDDE